MCVPTDSTEKHSSFALSPSSHSARQDFKGDYHGGDDGDGDDDGDDNMPVTCHHNHPGRTSK